MFRCFKARTNKKHQEVYFGLVRRIQKYYKKRHYQRVQNATIISKNIKTFQMIKKYKYLKIINKASNKARFVVNCKQMKFGFSQLMYNSKIITIQKVWRGICGRKLYYNILKLQSHAKLLHLFTKAYCRRLSHTLRHLK